MYTGQAPRPVFEFRAGNLALDYTNTVGGRLRSHPRDDLPEYVDLLRWAGQAGILSDREAERLTDEARARPGEATAVTARAREVREALYRIFLAAAEVRPVAAEDLEMLNAALRQTLGRLEIKTQAGDFDWDWVADDRALDRVLWPVVRSAATLLTSPELRQVRQCLS